MSATNSIRIIGNLGNKIEHRLTQSGTDVLSFSVAVQRPFKKEVTDWFDVTIFGKLAATMKQYLTTGTQVSVEGHLETYEFESKKNPGTKVRGMNIVASDIRMLSSKKTSGDSAVEEEAVEEEEYPF